MTSRMMDSHSQETLRRIEQNDTTLSILQIGYKYDPHWSNSDDRRGNYSNRDGTFNSRNSDDFSRLGASIKENTHLTDLYILLNGDGIIRSGRNNNGVVDGNPGAIGLDVTNDEFYEGIRQNSSFRRLELDCCYTQDIIGGVGHKILKAYK